MDTLQANVTGKKTPLTITIRSAMELSGLSRPTINRAIWAKKLRTTHIGSRHLIFFDSFQKFLGVDRSAD
jgi:predicted DNA-binding transcriptional regulator AlpA